MSNSFQLSGINLNQEKAPFILAEVACAHDGSVERVAEMIDSAASAGADGIQFQLFNTDRLLVPSHPMYERVKSLEISYTKWRQLIAQANDQGLAVFLNPLTPCAIASACPTEGMASNIRALKIHSADLANPNMLQKVAGIGLPVVLSCGGSTLDEVRAGISILEDAGVSNLLLMHGFQAYPTELSDAHLNYLDTLRQVSGYPVGYQDHVDGASQLSQIIPLLAMAKGAVLLEKHITDDRGRKGTDYESALDANSLRQFVNLVRETWQALGKSTMRPLSTAEHSYRRSFKKSIVAARTIRQRETITADMLVFMRGEQGLSPLAADKILGKKCTKDLQKHELITADVLI